MEMATRSGMNHGMIGRRGATGDEDALSSNMRIGGKGLESRRPDIARRRECANGAKWSETQRHTSMKTRDDLRCIPTAAERPAAHVQSDRLSHSQRCPGTGCVPC